MAKVTLTLEDSGEGLTLDLVSDPELPSDLNPASPLTNLENLEMELGDVLALVDMVTNAGLGVTAEGIEKARVNKMVRLSKYMHTWGDSSGV